MENMATSGKGVFVPASTFNTILTALAMMPYSQVGALMEEIKEVAREGEFSFDKPEEITDD